MKHLFIFLITISFISCKSEDKQKSNLIYEDESNFKSIRQVTFGGDNAEAYWSFDDEKLVFQSNNSDWGVGCDQMFIMNSDDTFDDSKPNMVSTGKGRTTCSYFFTRQQTYNLCFYSFKR